ncbi:hypothetical protein [Mycobacterium sp. URHB0021]|jgi:DNA-binding CsgD family transcriptional regulator
MLLSSAARTVEGHIYRAMAKTGTNSGEELTALLPWRGRDHDRTARLAP